MEIGKLTVKARANTGKGISRQLRAEGFVPGICYGVGLDEAVKVIIDPKALKGSLDPQKRTNTVIDVELEGEGKTVPAMVWDYQIHPIRRDILHVDLKAIDPNQSLETEVPVELIGKSPGVVNGGQLNVARHRVGVSCRPVDIPVKFELDISTLDVGGVLHVSDLALPEGVELTTPAKLTIVTCLAPKASADETVAVEGEEGAEGAPAAEGAAKPEEKKEGDA